MLFTDSWSRSVRHGRQPAPSKRLRVADEVSPASQRAFFSIDAAAATIARPVTFVRKFVSQYAPWLSLALGIASRVLFKHEIEFAPKAVALLLLAWTLPAIVARVLPDP